MPSSIAPRRLSPPRTPEPKFHPETRAGKRCSRFFRPCPFPASAVPPVVIVETPPSNSPRSTHSNLPPSIPPRAPAGSSPRCSPKYQSSQTPPPFFQSDRRTFSGPLDPPENEMSCVLSFEFRRKRFPASHHARGSQRSHPLSPAPPQSPLPARDAIPSPAHFSRPTEKGSGPSAQACSISAGASFGLNV